MNRIEQKKQEKELFIKYKPAFEGEMNERGAIVSKNLFLILSPVSLLLILVDLNTPFIASHFQLVIFARIGLPLVFLSLFLLTKVNFLKKYRLLMSTTALAFSIYYGTYLSAAVGNDVRMATLATATIIIVYSFSNSKTLITTIFMLFMFPLHFFFNILFNNTIDFSSGSGFMHLVVNAPIYMITGIILHAIVYRLKKQDFLNRQIVRKQNQKMTDELKIGQAVQESLMGKLPQKLGKNISLFLERHAFSEVSGDFYDLVKVSDRQYYLFMGDVSGHGVSAALITTMAKSLFNSIVSENLSTAEICTTFNKKLASELLDSNYYLTGIVLKIDPESSVIEYTNAGHTEPYFYKKAENKLEKLSTEDPILGMFEAEYKSKSIQMKEGDRLLLYTDGLYEAKNEKGEQYVDSFDKDFLKMAASIVSNLSKALLEKATKWSGEKGFNDDVTLLSFER
jgi:sigma-B regulation protein RsbU (phosphoserine phosphatase)